MRSSLTDPQKVDRWRGQRLNGRVSWLREQVFDGGNGKQASTRVQLPPGQFSERGCMRSISRRTPIIANALRLGLRPQPRSNDFPRREHRCRPGLHRPGCGGSTPPSRRVGLQAMQVAGMRRPPTPWWPRAGTSRQYARRLGLETVRGSMKGGWAPTRDQP